MIQMAEPSALNSESDNKVDQYVGANAKSENSSIKKEVEVVVKPEVVECAVCVSRSAEWCDMYSTRAAASGVSLHRLVCRLTRVDLAEAADCSRAVCRSCVDLLNLLDRAEREYDKLKETFRAIITKNPLFDTSADAAASLDPTALAPIKTELLPNGDDADPNDEDDSEDEPLARTKKRRYRKVDKRRKKPAPPKRKLRVRSGEAKNSSDSWECAECGLSGVGGAVGVAAHTLAAHTIETASVLRDVKTEHSADGDGSESPLFGNTFDSCLKIEFDKYYTDKLLHDSSSEVSDMISLDHDDTKNSKKKSKPKLKTIKVKKAVLKKKITAKEVHQCDQCDAKYTSWNRLERHKQKHEGSKPPYICEVCGAHYKHKRACDIHIALHKGISDWKCEECNKLFPSKSALQRHNNIHTGKLNYQCDQCGKSFIHTSSFKMHKLSHSGVKPHACDVCGLALMTRSHLKRHKRVHSGEKRHECPVCGKRFSERYNLVAHTKSHEPGAEAAQAAAAAAALALGPRRRLFRCAFCPERFERRYMLERHASVVHGRTLERPPPTPRNTMSKLLKAQAQRRDPHPPADPADPADPDPAPPADPADPHPDPDRPAGKDPPPTLTPQKLIAQLSSSSSSMITMGSWSGAYAAEFGLRHDYSH